MKIACLIMTAAALALAGCGSDGGDEEPTDFETIEKASGFSAEASEQAEQAIEALGQGDVETASERVTEARELAGQAQETLEEVEKDPTRLIFARINALTLEGYDVLAEGIEAAGRGDEGATDRYAREALAIRNEKLEFFNQTDFEAIGAGKNDKIREVLERQLQAEIGG